MKRILLIFVLLFLPVATSAQGDRPQTDGVTVVRQDDRVQVTFAARIPRRAAVAGASVAYVPVITDGTYRVSLPSIVVQGRRAAIAWQRHEWAADRLSRYKEAVYAKNGEAFTYRAEAPFQHWMQDAWIDLSIVTAACGDSFTGRSVLAGRILPAPPVEPEPVPEPIPEPEPLPPPSVGELLAQTFAFVLPASEFDPDEPIRFYDDERDNALTVYYRINSYDIDPLYAENRQTLVNLLAAIEVIEASDGVQIEQVVVAGFASPEGPHDHNDRLAWERAVSVKEYILKNSPMRDEDISIFNGSLDWHGLRRAVEAARVPLQQEVLALLDSRPAGRDLKAEARIISRLRALGGGRSYAYLGDRIFPLLRNGAFIRVYFSE